MEAARRLSAGAIVAFATETVYGLGADTFNVAAIERIYALKGRPARNPLIAHVAGTAEARRVAAVWDERCDRLAARFWPGPLTIVVPRSADVPDRATAGWPTIAIRAPAHPVAQRLLQAFGGPISAPSANRSGHVSPTTARHVAEDFPDAADLYVLDGGSCAVGIESTVVDLSGAPARVLRPGSVPASALAEILGEVATPDLTAQAAGPGTEPRHYAPGAAAELVCTASLPGRLSKLREPAVVLCLDRGSVEAPHLAIVMPSSPRAYAARLYDALREADACGRSRIVIEDVPLDISETEGLWSAIRDRLRRATRRSEE